MKIELHEILIKDLVNDYVDNKEEGVPRPGQRSALIIHLKRNSLI
jgi:hypothetical protein